MKTTKDDNRRSLQRMVRPFDEADANGSRIGLEVCSFGSRIRIGVIRGHIPTLWFFAPPTILARQWECPAGSWSMRVWRMSIARRPNDPSSATRPTRACDCNLDAMAGFAAAHG